MGGTYHSVALPYHDVVRRFHSFDVSGKVFIDFISPVSTDDDDFSRDSIGVDHYSG